MFCGNLWISEGMAPRSFNRYSVVATYVDYGGEHRPVLTRLMLCHRKDRRFRNGQWEKRGDYISPATRTLTFDVTSAVTNAITGVLELPQSYHRVYMMLDADELWDKTALLLRRAVTGEPMETQEWVRNNGPR